MYKPQAAVQASGGVLGGVPLLQADERPRGPIAERDHLPLVKPRTCSKVSKQARQVPVQSSRVRSGAGVGGQGPG